MKKYFEVNHRSEKCSNFHIRENLKFSLVAADVKGASDSSLPAAAQVGEPQRVVARS